MFTYPVADDTNMTGYLEQVKKLPSDAKGIY